MYAFPIYSPWRFDVAVNLQGEGHWHGDDAIGPWGVWCPVVQVTVTRMLLHRRGGPRRSLRDVDK